MEILFNAEGHVTGVAEGIDLHEYAEETGGTVVTMNGPQPGLEYEAYPDGEWRLPPEYLAQREEAWRAAEMPIARENVTAVDFGDETIPGTVAQWKAYWLAVRDWKEGHADYPDSTKRPARPA